MTGIMMAQAGASGAAAGGGGLLLETTVILSIILQGSDRPLTSFRAKIDGVGQKATGSTAAALVYTDLPNDVWHTGNPITGSDYEIYFDSVTNAATGAAGTWFGGARDVWTGLGGQQTYTWQKDTTNVGNATHLILIEIRNIATPSDTTGVKQFSFLSQVDL